MEDKTIDEFLKQLKDVQPQEATFNFLDVINKTHDENIISSWLAFLLRPDIAQDSLDAKPLKKIAEYFGIEIDMADVQIKREYYLENKRRIDIVIQTANLWIVIENKVNSFENNGQTNSYFEQIIKKTEGLNISVCFVYLKPDYSRSIPENEKFKENTITYGKLLKIWKDIKKSDFKNEACYIYFSEFIKLIREKYAVEQELNFNMNATIYKKNKKAINDLEDAFKSACKTVKEKLFSGLREVFSEEKGWIIRDTVTYIQIYKSSWQQGAIHYELGTWQWQKDYKGITFERLIDDEVTIDFCLHAETKDEIIKAEFTKFLLYQKNIEQKYNFGDEENCIKSIQAIMQQLREIDAEYTACIDGLKIC